MDINAVLQEYDSLFGKTTLTEIESYLCQKIKEAIEEQDDSAILTFLNEMIGLCRDTSQKEKVRKIMLLLCKILRMRIGRLDIGVRQKRLLKAFKKHMVMNP